MALPHMNFDIFAGFDWSGSSVAQRGSGWEQWRTETKMKDYEVMSYDVVCACAVIYLIVRISRKEADPFL